MKTSDTLTFIYRAYEYLASSEKLYKQYKEEVDESPLTVHNQFIEATDCERKHSFENLYTHTLFFIAQALKTLSESRLSLQIFV